MKLVSWVFMALLGLAIIILSIGNKADVTFSFYPLPFEMDVPLFVLILAGAFLGVLLGSLKTWMNDGKARRENRQNKREVVKLQGEITRLNRTVDEEEAALKETASKDLSLTDQRKSDAA